MTGGHAILPARVCRDKRIKFPADMFRRVEKSKKRGSRTKHEKRIDPHNRAPFPGRRLQSWTISFGSRLFSARFGDSAHRQRMRCGQADISQRNRTCRYDHQFPLPPGPFSRKWDFSRSSPPCAHGRRQLPRSSPAIIPTFGGARGPDSEMAGIRCWCHGISGKEAHSLFSAR